MIDLDELPYDALKMDGYDDCIIGTCERYGQATIIAYDKVKVIAKLRSSGMNPGEARDWFEFNQVGSWVGDMTPCFITIMEEDDGA